MIKLGFLLVQYIFLIYNAYLMTPVSDMSKENQNQQVFQQSSSCKVFQSTLSAVGKLESLIKEEEQGNYERIKKYLIDGNGYDIEVKQIIKGYWVPIDERVAVARTKHENYIYFFKDAGKWFIDSNNLVESIEVSQSYTDSLVILKDNKILDKSELKTLKQPCAVRVVIWIKNYILNVDLDEKKLIVFNRGT
jgi:hypothetical protein